jgi:hypothetical protein
VLQQNEVITKNRVEISVACFLRTEEWILASELSASKMSTKELLSSTSCSSFRLARVDSNGFPLPYHRIGELAEKRSTRVRSIVVQGFGSKEDLEVMIAISLICTRKCVAVERFERSLTTISRFLIHTMNLDDQADPWISRRV